MQVTEATITPVNQAPNTQQIEQSHTAPESTPGKNDNLDETEKKADILQVSNVSALFSQFDISARF
jgi:hypothetical protein